MCLRLRPVSFGALGAGREVDLREDLERLAALTLERLAEHRLGGGVGVDVRGVERRDAGIEGRVHRLDRRVVLDLRAVGHPVAVRDLRDLEAAVAEVAIVHHGINATGASAPAGPRRGRRRDRFHRIHSQMPARVPYFIQGVSGGTPVLRERFAAREPDLEGEERALNTHVAPSALVPRLLLGWPADADPHLRVDGTAVVVDISGFTTLSEQLAAAGREGTEQLIATLSRIFTVLLPVDRRRRRRRQVRRRRAASSCSPATDHAQHAVHAAWNMNRVLARDRRHPSARPRGRSCGCRWACTPARSSSSSPAPRTSASCSPAATRRGCSSCRRPPTAGQILVSDETAALLPAKQVAADPETARRAPAAARAGRSRPRRLMALSVGRSAGGRALPPPHLRPAPRPARRASPTTAGRRSGSSRCRACPTRPDADDLGRDGRAHPLGSRRPSPTPARPCSTSTPRRAATATSSPRARRRRSRTRRAACSPPRCGSSRRLAATRCARASPRAASSRASSGRRTARPTP